MEIKTISVVYQRKFNLGNYESLEIGCSLWAQIDPEEDADGATEFLYQQAKTSVKEAVMPVLKSSGYLDKNKQSVPKNTQQDKLDDF
ncbi:hypothetical protein NIES4074_62720 (plasmid) [Cylindrospermum sp. NIES-4074]|nr:hypothetical protein NIES4074_62720 [Cylindrospermum sp. NIES-4074]